MKSLPDLPKLPKTPKAGKPGKLPKLPARPSDPEPDPLADVEYTGSIEEDSKREFTALEDGYRKRAKNEDKRYKNAMDGEFYFVACFASFEERDKFLQACGYGKNDNFKYVNGHDLADRLNLDLTD